MRAAQLTEVGGTPIVADVPDPQPREGYELAEVIVAGLNPFDLAVAAGALGPPSLPAGVGLEGIARLDGRPVYFDRPPSPLGAIAQLTLVRPSHVFDVPESLDPGTAVAFGVAGLAAWLSLTAQAQLQPGEDVLITGASGVVGQIGVQAAKLLGAGRVVAAARDRAALESLRTLGADEIVVLGEGADAQALRDAAGSGGFQVVLDTVYGPVLEAALPATGPGARIVVLSAKGGDHITLPLSLLYGRRIIGHNNAALPIATRREAYERMVAHAAAGELVVEVERVALERVREAWERQAHGPHRKLVIEL